MYIFGPEFVGSLLCESPYNISCSILDTSCGILDTCAIAYPNHLNTCTYLDVEYKMNEEGSMYIGCDLLPNHNNI